MITGIYIKPSKRKCSISNYKCFDIYDQDMNLIPMKDCDVIEVRIENIKIAYINLEVVNGMIHLWAREQLDFEPLINTFIVHLENKQ